MKTISIHDAKTNLSKYIAAAKKGENIYVGGFGEPEVLMVKVSDAEYGSLNKRVFSIAKGKVKAGRDAFSGSTDKNNVELMLDK